MMSDIRPNAAADAIRTANATGASPASASDRSSRALRPLRHRWVDQALELLLPSTCRWCDRCVAAGVDFCGGCQLQLESSAPLMQSACRRCGRPGAAAATGPAAQPTPAAVGVLPRGQERRPGCPACRDTRLHFDGCVALWTYDGLVRNAVIAAKYGSQVALADALGRRLGQRVLQAWELGINGSAERPQPARARSGPEEPHGAEETPTPELVTGVPSHLFRRIQRGGGGGSALVASLHRVLRQRWSHCRLADVLTTTRRVKKQALMGESQRTANVRDAFALRRRRWRPRTPRRASGHLELAGRHVLLVDDVMTTGATADENARVLKLAGASRVTVAVVARAVGGC